MVRTNVCGCDTCHGEILMLRSMAFVVAAASLCCDPILAATLTGRIHDAKTGESIAARVYIQSSQGQWFFAQTADKGGKAVEYRKERGSTSVEMHTALSAHPFTVELPLGKYKLTVERGKEYLPHE